MLAALQMAVILALPFAVSIPGRGGPYLVIAGDPAGVTQASGGWAVGFQDFRFAHVAAGDGARLRAAGAWLVLNLGRIAALRE